jgi:hypothetical protein
MSSVTDLEQRIAQLEKMSRRWKGIAAAVMVGLVASISIGADPGAPTTDEVRTRKLTIVDQAGLTVGEITSDESKFSGLKFYNPQTHTVVSALGVTADKMGFLETHTMIQLDDQGRTVADMTYANGKASGWRFYNPDTKCCVSGFGLGTDGSGVEFINTTQGKQVVVHSGAVNDQGVPLENIQRALEDVRRATVP